MTPPVPGGVDHLTRCNPGASQARGVWVAQLREMPQDSAPSGRQAPGDATRIVTGRVSSCHESAVVPVAYATRARPEGRARAAPPFGRSYWRAVPPPPDAIWASVGAAAVLAKKIVPTVLDAKLRLPLVPKVTGMAVV